MRRLLITLLLLLGLSTVASARDSVKGWCEEGNRPVVTSGLSSTTRVQASHPSCIITVYIHGAGLATIYADNNGTPLANPFTAQSGGRWQAYANNGRYDVTMSSAGFSQTVTYSDIILCDPFETGSTCNNGGAVTAHNLLSTTHLDTVPESPPVRGDLITAQNQTSPTGVNPSWAALPIGTNGQVLTSTGIDAVWGTLTAGTGITISSTGGNTTISTSGGGSGCTLPGTDTGILTEHPVGTCYNSTHATWNDTTPDSTHNGHILLIGDGTASVAAPSAGNYYEEVFLFGHGATATPKASADDNLFLFGRNTSATGCSECFYFGNGGVIGSGTPSIGDIISMGFQNTLDGLGSIFVFGDSNVVKTGTIGPTGMWVMGQSNSVDSTNAGVVGTSMYFGISSTWTLGGSRALIVDTQAMGSGDQFTVNDAAVASTNKLDCLHGIGGNNHFTIAASLSGNNVITDVEWVGKNNTVQITTTGPVSISKATIAGHSNTIQAVSGTNMLNVGTYGDVLTLTDCSSCYAIGKNVTLGSTQSNTLAIGMSASDIGLVITNSGGTHDNVKRTPMVFASLPACAAGTEGSFAAITDSSTNTWGATITGSSTNHVLGYCDGTNWTVAGK